MGPVKLIVHWEELSLNEGLRKSSWHVSGDSWLSDETGELV